MLRNRGLRDRQFLDDIAADAGRASHQDAQDLDPDWVTDRLAQCGQFIIGLLAFNRPQVGCYSRSRTAAHRRLCFHRKNTMTPIRLPV